MNTEVALADQFAPPPALLRAKTQFETTLREAKVYAAADIVPTQYRDNLANCYIAVNMAHRIGMDPLQCMQALYIVQGKPGWSGQFLIAAFNQCGRFTAMRFETRGDIDKKEPTSGMRAYATEKSTGEVIRSPWVTWKMVDGEHWADKAGSKWKTMHELMFTYRSAAFLVRTHAPEISMGLQSTDEITDVIDVTPSSQTDSAPPPARPGAVEQARDAVAKVLTPESVVPSPTYAEVADAINSATDDDSLSVARDLIRTVTEQLQRDELTILAKDKADALAAA